MFLFLFFFFFWEKELSLTFLSKGIKVYRPNCPKVKIHKFISFYMWQKKRICLCLWAQFGSSRLMAVDVSFHKRNWCSFKGPSSAFKALKSKCSIYIYIYLAYNSHKNHIEYIVNLLICYSHCFLSTVFKKTSKRTYTNQMILQNIKHCSNKI